ncbi:MAG TPA: GNAT family N-acetyltransferase [Vicinamibacterales bacterium]|jgi:ribosomal protein S18 acetylase RimI-like enzyme|nr:GNAT family N-acetyltransferase [Vicinamibacterales bacterium]
MICQDWRTCASSEIAPLLAAEMRAWRRELDWDVTEAWSVVEPARRAGTLPGFVVRDRDGRPAGWTSFLLHRTSLQVLAFVATSTDAATTLVDAILSSRESTAADVSLFCVRDASPRLRDVLEAQAFDVEDYRYLGLALTPDRAATIGDEADSRLRPWRDDTSGAVRLYERAYAGMPGVRAFALSGAREEWAEYLAGLLSGPGCGWFVPELSYVVPAAGSADLAGGVIVTDLGPSTAHIAQIAVDPAYRGQGWGRRLVRAAGRAAFTRGYTQMTLLVSASNRAAIALYEDEGFQDRATFLVASRRQPILSTSDALAIGGESTRR